MNISQKAANKIEAKLLYHTAEALKFENEWKHCLKNPEDEESIRLAYACMSRHQGEQEIYQHILDTIYNDR